VIAQCQHERRGLTIVGMRVNGTIRWVLAGKCADCRVLLPLHRGWRTEYAGAFAQAERPNRRTSELPNALHGAA